MKEDEISVRSSKCVFKRPDGTMTNVLVGDALVARYPCKLPTDVRKVGHARLCLKVYAPELTHSFSLRQWTYRNSTTNGILSSYQHKEPAGRLIGSVEVFEPVS